MGEALAAGLISAGWAEPTGITIVEPIDERREELKNAQLVFNNILKGYCTIFQADL